MVPPLVTREGLWPFGFCSLVIQPPKETLQMEETPRARLKRLISEMKKALLSGDGELANAKEEEFFQVLEGLSLNSRYAHHTSATPQEDSKD